MNDERDLFSADPFDGIPDAPKAGIKAIST